MKCEKCDNKDLAFVEETKSVMGLFYYLVKYVGYIIGLILIAINFYAFKLQINIVSLIGIFLLILTLLSTTYYKIRFKRTSKTKVICKECGHWWYLE